jgi:hypothetical protein
MFITRIHMVLLWDLFMSHHRKEPKDLNVMPDVIAHNSHGSPSIEWKEGKLGQVSRMSYTPGELSKLWRRIKLVTLVLQQLNMGTIGWATTCFPFYFKSPSSLYMNSYLFVLQFVLIGIFMFMYLWCCIHDGYIMSMKVWCWIDSFSSKFVRLDRKLWLIFSLFVIPNWRTH